MSDKEAAEAQLQSAVQTAVQKVREEMQAAAPGSTDDVVKKHQEELRALEQRLVKKHEEVLKAAADTTKSSDAPTVSETDQKALVEAAVAAAIAAREQEFTKTLEAEKIKATESGRMEAQAKAKLKDAQLVRAQARLKELETQMKDLQDKGVIPAQAAPAKPGAATAPKPTAAAGPSQAKPTPAPPVTRSTSSSATAPSNSSLPQKPGAVPVPGVGRGRGGAPRGVPRNAVAAGLSIRGAAPAATDNAAAGTSGGVSIAGAAAKRAREDGEGDASLAKRLKPAATPNTGGGPVQLNRNRVPPPAPQ